MALHQPKFSELAIQINLLVCPLSIPSAIICLCVLLNFDTKKKQFLFHCFSLETKECECVHFDFVCFLMLLPLLSAEYKLDTDSAYRIVRFACGISCKMSQLTQRKLKNMFKWRTSASI